MLTISCANITESSVSFFLEQVLLISYLSKVGAFNQMIIEFFFFKWYWLETKEKSKITPPSPTPAIPKPRYCCSHSSHIECQHKLRSCIFYPVRYCSLSSTSSCYVRLTLPVGEVSCLSTKSLPHFSTVSGAGIFQQSLVLGFPPSH